MPKSLAELRVPIDAALASNSDRSVAFATAAAESCALAAKLPLVHRTAWPGQGGDWREILIRKIILASPDITPEERACGFERAAYFFLGSAAYDKGTVAFLLESAVAIASSATFTPFDTGGLSTGRSMPEPGCPAKWEMDDRAAYLELHCGAAPDLAEFAGVYLAAHFRAPCDYVARAQVSDPDFPAYHGIVSRNGDRRAWTIEVRAHADVPLDATRTLRWIVLGRKQLRHDVPEELRGHVVVALAPSGEDGDVPRAVTRRILADWRGTP